MSVDFYVAVPADQWPTAVALERCASREGYPIRIKRLPILDTEKVVRDGAIVNVEGDDAYLEGELSPPGAALEEVSAINEQLAASADAFRIDERHVLVSFRTRSPGELRATGYVFASLAICFGGYGFEPQGGAHGGVDVAKSLIQSFALLNER